VFCQADANNPQFEKSGRRRAREEGFESILLLKPRVPGLSPDPRDCSK
jgi:hypothetical protein